jgi:16S rRNA processing protein RimM
MLIPLGKLVGTHATYGEIRMRPFNPESATLGVDCTVVLCRGAERHIRRICAVRRHKHYLLLSLEGCDSMDAARQLVGCEVCVDERALPAAGPGEVYHYQLIGMTVVTVTGADVGAVAEVLHTPANDVCVVRAGEQEHLIPLIADVIVEIDHVQRRLVIRPLPGLIEP